MARVVTLLATLAAGLLLMASPGAAHRTGNASGVQRMGSFETQFLGQLNAMRARRGLRPLRISRSLSAAAAEHSDQMAVRGYFAHESADGTSPDDRVEHYYPSRGYRYWSFGENLLWESPTTSPAGALAEWMGSRPHRANLLSRDWREIGIAAVHAASAPGVYGGSPVTILTTDFGVRR